MMTAKNDVGLVRGDHAGARLATRIAFLVSGFGLACWAPLVPLAKARLGIDEGTLGLLLLCLGLGSVAAMQLSGPLTSRLGAKPVVLIGGGGLTLLLPLLTVASTTATMALVLLAFGGFMGTIEVGMNVHAVEVERHAGRPMMSGFHGLFSVGGLAGATLLTFILSAGLSALAGTLLAAAVMVGALTLAAPRLIATSRADETPLLVLPRGTVILLALLAASTFLSEGAILNWGALLLTDKGLLTPARAGIGYSVFAVAMTVGRLTGDRVVARLGDRQTMFWGGLLAIVGFGVLLTTPVAMIAMLGLLLIGLGASNTVPVLFRQAGAQTVMPAGLAVAAVTTIGYAGILAGPAAIGFVAKQTGLQVAFWMLAGLLCLVPLLAGVAVRKRSAVKTYPATL
ncbi:Predicted arabinose efflux permease, MFS family [Sphingomonas gellani]|uniref:Predicted arabinose efflux permease, MFS family n=1 Tax=Sphingomonas gellani TaxID=1166340 RepID=A0A1H8GWL5_9SPHN|nr:MFS transporter [Sphingomonas gellani]SEN48210.1 Predicted arabinose efflux permease, MFS family [Sphingomonas gellani]